MSETKERHAKRLGYETARLKRYLPPLRVLLEKEYGPSFERVLARRGAKKGGYVAALLRKALAIEDQGGDAMAVLERALADLGDIAAGKTQIDPGSLKGGD